MPASLAPYVLWEIVNSGGVNGQDRSGRAPRPLVTCPLQADKRGAQTMEESHEEALTTLREVFEHRITQRLVQRRSLVREGKPSAEGPLAFVLPVSAEEVELLAEVAERYSVPLIALGARTAPNPQISTEQGSTLSDMKRGSILIRFDLMRRTRLPTDPEEPWVEAEPGALWLELDNDLRARGRGLAVYPTSAPRATVGGWLAMDGLGVGSFEYGWLSENILSADVVLPGGERREVRGEELLQIGRTGETTGIVVGATLRTRRADTDVPFGGAFDDPEDLVRTIVSIQEAGVPLWHLAFLDPRMARARNSGDDYLLFGAYPRERAAAVEKALQGAFESHGGRVLPAAETYHVWGERFFPVAPSRPAPTSTERMLVTLAETKQALISARDRSANVAIQGTVARTGEVLLLTFDAQEERWAS